MTEWIKVENKLPPCHDIVLVKTSDREEMEAYFHKDKMDWLHLFGQKTSYFQRKNGEWLYNVTHWKPLSEEKINI